VEEAFNQEPGVFQNIFGVQAADDGAWEATFTQEWPLVSHAHQISFTLPASGSSSGSGVGDVLINYRWQVADETATRPAFSPRLSLIMPTGSPAKGTGSGRTGWQLNLPFSKQFGDAYVHWNAGVTHTDLFVPQVALSGIWRARPMLNLMLESVFQWNEGRVLTLSPGLRTGWNTEDTQTVIGIAAPAEWSNGDATLGIFGYFSYEGPFN